MVLSNAYRFELSLFAVLVNAIIADVAGSEGQSWNVALPLFGLYALYARHSRATIVCVEGYMWNAELRWELARCSLSLADGAAARSAPFPRLAADAGGSDASSSSPFDISRSRGIRG
jgi:hypothetical protein